MGSCTILTPPAVNPTPAKSEIPPREEWGERIKSHQVDVSKLPLDAEAFLRTQGEESVRVGTGVSHRDMEAETPHPNRPLPRKRSGGSPPIFTRIPIHITPLTFRWAALSSWAGVGAGAGAPPGRPHTSSGWF